MDSELLNEKEIKTLARMRANKLKIRNTRKEKVTFWIGAAILVLGAGILVYGLLHGAISADIYTYDLAGTGKLIIQNHEVWTDGIKLNSMTQESNSGLGITYAVVFVITAITSAFVMNMASRRKDDMKAEFAKRFVAEYTSSGKFKPIPVEEEV